MTSQQRPKPSVEFDGRFLPDGAHLLAGVDEAGRGPLAGPVVAAAVILNAGAELPGLDDSKRLSPRRRERLYERITAAAACVGIGVVSPEEIDRINILQASLRAMRIALASLQAAPDVVLVDGIQRPGSGLPEVAIAGGDSRSAAIAAASVIAKVTRDRLMVSYDSVYPGYGFAIHKGYPTAKHRESLARHGPCAIHRRSFGPVRELLSLFHGSSGSDSRSAC